jgi:hypothetical protein
MKTSAAERIRLAGAAIDIAIDKLDGDGQFDCTAMFATIRCSFTFFVFQAKVDGVTGNLYSQMAQFDIATNQTKYQDKLGQFLPFQERMNNNFSNPT